MSPEKQRKAIGQRFTIGQAECVYRGQICPYAGNAGPWVDVLEIPAIRMPDGKGLTLAYKPGTWEHGITSPEPLDLT